MCKLGDVNSRAKIPYIFIYSLPNQMDYVFSYLISGLSNREFDNFVNFKCMF